MVSRLKIITYRAETFNSSTATPTHSWSLDGGMFSGVTIQPTTDLYHLQTQAAPARLLVVYVSNIIYVPRVRWVHQTQERR